MSYQQILGNPKTGSEEEERGGLRSLSLSEHGARWDSLCVGKEVATLFSATARLPDRLHPQLLLGVRLMNVVMYLFLVDFFLLCTVITHKPRGSKTAGLGELRAPRKDVSMLCV